MNLNSEDRRDITFFSIPIIVLIITHSISSILIHLYLLEINAKPSIIFAVNLYTFSLLLSIVPMGILFMCILDKRIKDRQKFANNEKKEGR
jgi:hypothetical protein